MKYVNQWEQVVDCEIDRIVEGHVLRIYLNGSESVLQLETVSESRIDILTPDSAERIEASSLLRKRISMVVVPYLGEDCREDPSIRVKFDDATEVLLAPEDGFSIIRIT